MADLSIPGVNGQYDKLIEAIMKAERIPREKEESSLEKFKGQLVYWQTLNQFGVQVRDVARSFYSFNNPFNEHLASSSNEMSFTVVAGRDAKEQSARIFIKQVATADSFLSNELPKDTKVEAGHYVFRVGEKEVVLDWKGGNYKSFMQAINRRGKGILSVSEIKVTPKSTAILFSSLHLGEKNKMTFADDALNWAEKVGIIKKGEASKELVEHANVKVAPFSSTELKLPLLTNTKDAEYVEITFVLGDARKNAIIASELKKTEENAQKEGKSVASNESNIPSSNVSGGNENNFEAVGYVAYEGVVVRNNPSDSSSKTIGKTDSENSQSPQTLNDENSVENEKLEDIEKLENDEPKTTKDNDKNKNTTEPNKVNSSIQKDLQMFSLKFENGELSKLEDAKDTEEKQSILISLTDTKKLSSILLKNDNSFTMNVESVKVITKSFEDEYIPSHSATRAGDAVISYQGIDMKRDSNTITDIIPSLTLNLHSQTEKAEELSIKPNVEMIKNSIIEFIGKYNRLIAEINILTSNKVEVVEELTYFTDEEKDAALKRLGTFYGDTMLSSLKNNLHSRMTNAYGSSSDLSIKLLAQIGISTNASSTSGVDTSRLRGYLEIDEKVLEKTLNDDIEGVKSFFGFDSDGDIIIDNGLAYTIYEYLNPYTQRGGIFFGRMTSIEDKIKTSEKRIVAYDKKLMQKEAELKRKYGAMEGTLRDLKKQSDAISNFNKASEK